ncbi:MAG: branched-chain amino acid ABC transporter permease [Patescibacteria group bacterium]
MSYFISILNLILIYIILTESYNLVLGYTGMVHIGHVAFMAIGAYASALITAAGYPFWMGLVGGISISALCGLILAIPTVRFKEDYFVAATLGMGEIIRLIIINERDYTGGSTGITKIARPELFGISFASDFALLAFNAVITLIVLLFVYRLVSSPFGKVLESIREDEIAAESLGKNTWAVKVQILIIAAALAGLSGVLYAHTLQFIDPETFNIHRLIFIFLIVIFGGSGNFWGPVVGTIILFTIFEAMRFLPLKPAVLGPLRWMIYSAILIAIIILKPKGIMGEKLTRKKL